MNKLIEVRTHEQKKEKLEKVYSKALKFLKSAYKGLKENNVEEVQWWLGDLFILLCENKELVDPIIYEAIVNLKNNLMNSVTTLLFFHTKFKSQKKLEQEMSSVVRMLEERVLDIQLFLQTML